MILTMILPQLIQKGNGESNTCNEEPWVRRGIAMPSVGQAVQGVAEYGLGPSSVRQAHKFRGNLVIFDLTPSRGQKEDRS